MTKEEFAPVIMGIKAIYPKEMQSSEADELWFRLLQDLPAEKVRQAVQAHMMTSVYPPKPAHIRAYCTASETAALLTEAEAWAMVHKAIKNGAYGAREEFDKLPPAVQRAVGSPDNLRDMGTDENFNIGVESSNFKRAYRAEMEREKEVALLPEGVRKKLAGITPKQLGGEK